MAARTITRRGDDAALRRDVAVVGASAGGVEALIRLVRGIGANSPLALLVVLHLPAGANSRLADILDRAGPLPAEPARDGCFVSPGSIHVAPPDRHLVLSDGRMSLLDGPRENGFRPAVDPLFRSAARVLGPRAVGVILSGTMDDGTAGLAAIHSVGGTTVVQEPSDALASGMPRSAIESVSPDHVLPATEIGRLLDQLARSEVRSASRASGADLSLLSDPMELAPRGVDIACPECGGALQEVQAGKLPRFRCRTGHIYSPLTLLETKGAELEAALWAALRTLEEEASVAGRLAARSRGAGAGFAARRYETRQGEAAHRAHLIRQTIASIGSVSVEGPDEIVTARETRPGVVVAR